MSTVVAAGAAAAGVDDTGAANTQNTNAADITANFFKCFMIVIGYYSPV
ncbi:MAG: hypothetical protein ACK5KM_02690 [Hyphomicrobiaceae bacterium]